MRYYDITVLNKDGSNFARWKTLTSAGLPDPGALNVELDIPIYSFDTPAGAGYVKVWGIGLPTISQSSNFNGKTIKILMGMSKGLPLANPTQVGLPLTGQIFQAFGNWQGITQTLDIVFYAATGSDATPANITIDWKAGTALSTAIDNTLKTAFPNLKRNIQISQDLVLTHDQPGSYSTLSAFNDYVNEISQSILLGSYRGVKISISNGAVNVLDATQPSQKNKKLAILFTDLIGQPTWLDVATIQFHCVLRGDLSVGLFITLPQTQQTTTQSSNSQFRNNLSFQGTFQIIRIRNVGNFRTPNAESWITIVDAVSQEPAK